MIGESTDDAGEFPIAGGPAVNDGLAVWCGFPANGGDLLQQVLGAERLISWEGAEIGAGRELVGGSRTLDRHHDGVLVRRMQTMNQIQQDALSAAKVIRFVVDNDDSHRQERRQCATILQYGVLSEVRFRFRSGGLKFWLFGNRAVGEAAPAVIADRKQ